MRYFDLLNLAMIAIQHWRHMQAQYMAEKHLINKEHLDEATKEVHAAIAKLEGIEPNDNASTINMRNCIRAWSDYQISLKEYLEQKSSINLRVLQKCGSRISACLGIWKSAKGWKGMKGRAV